MACASRAGRNAWSTVKISALFSSVRHAQILQLFQAEIVKIIEVVTKAVMVELFPSLVSPPWHQVSNCLAEKKKLHLVKPILDNTSSPYLNGLLFWTAKIRRLHTYSWHFFVFFVLIERTCFTLGENGKWIKFTLIYLTGTLYLYPFCVAFLD